MITEKITMYANKANGHIIHAVEGENLSRLINVTILDAAGSNLSLAGKTASLYIRKNDGNLAEEPGTIEDNQMSFQLHAQSLTCPGSNEGFIELTDEIGSSVLRIGSIFIEVKPCSTENAEVSKTILPSVAQAIINANAAAQEATNAAGSISVATAAAQAAKASAEIATEKAEALSSSMYKVERVKNDIALFDSGRKAINAVFINGGLGSGAITSSKNRVVSSAIISYDYPAYVSIVTAGYKFGIHTYNDSNAFLKDSGWQTGSFYLPKNQKFRIVIAMVAETQDTADVDIFSGAVAVTTCLQSKHDTSIEPLCYFSQEKFELGSLWKGNPTDSTASRVRLKALTTLNRSITISITNGFQFSVMTYNDGAFSAESGWQTTPYTIPAGTQFKLLLANIADTIKDLESVYKSLRIDGYNSIDDINRRIELLNLDTYTHSYTGEEINFRKHGFNWSQLYQISIDAFKDKLTTTGCQGCALYNDVLFTMRTDNYVSLHSVIDGSLISHYALQGSEHGNEAGFLAEKFDAADEFPLLYVSPNRAKDPRINIYRVTRTGAALVKTITIPYADAGNFCSFCLDAENSILYSIGYTQYSYRDSTDNPMKIISWSIKELTVNSDGTYSPKRIDSFTLPFINTVQGNKFFDGKLLVISSQTTGTSQTAIYAIDPTKRRIITAFDKLPDGIRNQEIEDMVLRLNGDRYDMYLIDLSSKVYKLSF